MNTLSWPARALALTLLCTSALSHAQSPPRAVAPPDREQIERRLASTTTLIESSSGARQIAASGNPAAETAHTWARTLLRDAAEALRAGRLELAAGLIDEAARAMVDSVRLAAPDQLERPKQQRDFELRLESTRALLAAQKRIAADKGAGAPAADLSRRVEAQISEAVEHAKSGRLPQARAVLEGAYLEVRSGAVGLRDGETVVRSLNFANKAEEYAYEVDRNDTHRMLIQVLLKDRRTEAMTAMVDRQVAEADRLRSQAQAQADRGDHAAAVATMELSTRELVRAIRASGVYIPG